MGKKVPLVIYDGKGNRRIIGDAVVDIDGGVEMTITDGNVMETLSRMTEHNVGEFSIGFHPLMPPEITHPPELPSFEEVTREVIREQFENDFHLQMQGWLGTPIQETVIPNREIHYHNWLQNAADPPPDMTAKLVELRDNLDKEE